MGVQPQSGYGMKVNFWPRYNWNTYQADPYQQIYCEKDYNDESIDPCAIPDNPLYDPACGTSVSGYLQSTKYEDNYRCLSADDRIGCFSPQWWGTGNNYAIYSMNSLGYQDPEPFPG